MADPKQTSDNFDKEFSMKQKTKSAPRGKLPSWIMILAGVAAIGGAVAARQPAIRPVENGHKASVNVTDNTMVVDNAGYTGMNDLKADSSELEAFFGAQTGSGSPVTTDGRIIYTADHDPFSMNVIPLELDDNGFIIPPEDPDQDAAVYWVDDKPYAITIKPADAEAKEGNEKEFTGYTIGDEEYTVRLEKLSAEDVSKLPEEEKAGVIQVGGESYKLDLKAAPNTADNSDAELPEKAQMSADPGKASDTDIADTDKPVATDKEEAEQPEKAEDLVDSGKSPDTASNSKDQPVSPDGGNTSVPEKADTSANSGKSPDAAPDGKNKSVTADSSAASGETSGPARNSESDSSSALSKEPASSGTDVTTGPESPVIVPDSDPIEDEGEVPVITWVDEKPYKVEVKPVSAPSAKPEPINLDNGSKPEKEAETSAVFEVEGKKYEVQLIEADPEKLPAENTASPIIWVDRIPLEVSASSAGNADGMPEGENETFEIVLKPVEEEKLPELMKEHFGEDYLPTPTPEPTAVPETAVPEPEPEPETEKSDDNWFVNIFHNIFGAEPTATPTPQVTVIPVNTEPAPVKPTPAPIVVRVAPVAEPTIETEEPVQPDDPNISDAGTGMFDPAAGSDEEDKTVPEDHQNEENEVNTEQKTGIQESEGSTDVSSEIDTAVTDKSDSNDDQSMITAKSDGDDDQSMISIKPTRGPEPVKLSPTVIPEQEELPHTGMADGWNIPSMLALFTGLMLLIIGIRRLRSRE